MSSNICQYLDELTWEYAQWCKRPKDGSYYAIADGKRCKKGTPVNYVPEAKAKTKALSKSSNKAKNTETKPNKKISGSGGRGSAARKKKIKKLILGKKFRILSQQLSLGDFLMMK